MYISMSLRRMMYGLDVSDISPNSLNCLENTHWEMANVIQGLNQSTPNPAVLPAISWYLIESLIGKARIDFLLRKVLLEPDNVYKRVAIIRIYQYQYKHTNQSMGPVQRAMQYASKYDLLVSIINAIETENIMKIRELMKNIKLAMENLENQSWEASVLLLYGGMNVYKDVMKIQRRPWFWSIFCRKKPKFTKHCQLFLRLLTVGRLHDRDNSQYRCCLCNTDVQDKVSHYLFTCTSLQERRDIE